MDTLAATLVTGLPGADKTVLLRRWLAARPAGERWALLLNRADAGGFRASLPGGRSDADAAFANGLVADAIERVGGCACCAGRLAFESALLRLLRRGPWDRLLIELDGSGDPARFVDLLRSGVAGRHLRLDEVVAVLDAGIARSWLAEADASGLRGNLLAAQIAAADRVVLTACDRLADPAACGALVAALKARPPFRRRVELARDDQIPGPPGVRAPDWPEVWLATAANAEIAQEWALAPLQATGARHISVSHATGLARLAWRWPPEAEFDRAALERLIADWRALPGLQSAQGAFRTTRDWYLWRRDGSRDAWSPTAWRRDNRLEMQWAADRAALRPVVLAVEAGLAGALRAPPAGTIHA